ncbi:MAG: hypothetical protein V1821_00180 [bacterium]
MEKFFDKLRTWACNNVILGFDPKTGKPVQYEDGKSFKIEGEGYSCRVSILNRFVLAIAFLALTCLCGAIAWLYWPSPDKVLLWASVGTLVFILRHNLREGVAGGFDIYFSRNRWHGVLVMAPAPRRHALATAMHALPYSLLVLAAALLLDVEPIAEAIVWCFGPHWISALVATVATCLSVAAITEIEFSFKRDEAEMRGGVRLKALAFLLAIFPATYGISIGIGNYLAPAIWWCLVTIGQLGLAIWAHWICASVAATMTAFIVRYIARGRHQLLSSATGAIRSTIAALLIFPAAFGLCCATGYYVAPWVLNNYPLVIIAALFVGLAITHLRQEEQMKALLKEAARAIAQAANGHFTDQFYYDQVESEEAGLLKEPIEKAKERLNDRSREAQSQREGLVSKLSQDERELREARRLLASTEQQRDVVVSALQENQSRVWLLRTLLAPHLPEGSVREFMEEVLDEMTKDPPVTPAPAA